MNIEFHVSDGVVYGTLDGRLDTISAQTIDISDFIDNADKKIVFDCTNLTFISSTGLRLLLALYKECLAKGGSITMKAVSPLIMSVFQISGFVNMFSFE